MSGHSRDIWVWDLFPLSSHSWGNLQRRDDGLQRGQTVTIERDRPQRHWAPGSVTIIGAIPVSRRFYVPTESDLSILRHRYPKDDPNRPAWFQIKAALIVAGHAAKKLDRTEAPVLLALLANAHKGASSKVGLTDADETEYLSPGECIDSFPLKEMSMRQKRHQLDLVRKRCSWLRKNQKGHIHPADWKLVTLLLKKRSTSKKNVSDAVETLPRDLDEMERMKAEIKSENLAKRRARK